MEGVCLSVVLVSYISLCSVEARLQAASASEVTFGWVQFCA